MQKRKYFTNLSTKGKKKKCNQVPLQKHHSFCYFQAIRLDKANSVDQDKSYNNTIGPVIYMTCGEQYCTKTLNRNREKNNLKLNHLKKSESLSCVGIYDQYERPDYPEPDCEESQRRSYLQLLKGDYTSPSSRNFNPDPNYGGNFNTLGPKGDRSKHKKLLYADLTLGNHNLKFQNTVNSNKRLYTIDTHSVGNVDINKDVNTGSNRKGNHKQRNDYASLKFSEINV